MRVEYEFKKKTAHHRFMFTDLQDEECSQDLKLGNISFSRSKRAQAVSNSPNRIEVTVHRAFEQHPTPQKNDHRLCESENGLIHEKSNVWSLGDDVERGM